jgi:hypothetical protein
MITCVFPNYVRCLHLQYYISRGESIGSASTFHVLCLSVKWVCECDQLGLNGRLSSQHHGMWYWGCHMFICIQHTGFAILAVLPLDAWLQTLAVVSRAPAISLCISASFLLVLWSSSLSLTLLCLYNETYVNQLVLHAFFSSNQDVQHGQKKWFQVCTS